MKDAYTICAQCGKSSRNAVPEYWGEFKMPTIKAEGYGASYHAERSFWLCWGCAQDFAASLPIVKITTEKKK